MQSNEIFPTKVNQSELSKVVNKWKQMRTIETSWKCNWNVKQIQAFERNIDFLNKCPNVCPNINIDI
jgi:hypothetical protein